MMGYRVNFNQWQKKLLLSLLQVWQKSVNKHCNNGKTRGRIRPVAKECATVPCQYGKRPVNTHGNSGRLQGRSRPVCGKKNMLLSILIFTKHQKYTQCNNDRLQAPCRPKAEECVTEKLPVWQKTKLQQWQVAGSISTSGKKCITLRRHHDKKQVNSRQQ